MAETRHVLLPDLSDSDGSTPALDARRVTGLAETLFVLRPTDG